MAKKSSAQEPAPTKPSVPVPESEVVSMGDQLSDDPDTAAAQILGGQTDQGDPKDGDQRSGTEKVTIGDQEYEIDSGLASALEAQREDFQKQHDELRGLMPKRPVVEPEPKLEPKPDGKGWGNMIFDDPERFVQEFGEDIRQKTIDEMKGQYSADQGMRDFWTSFYRENEDLREFDPYVQVSLNRHSSELMDLPVSQAVAKLAEAARSDILSLVNKFTPSKDGKSSRTTVESGRSSQTSTPKTGEGEGDKPQSDNVSSISSALRDRKRRRREASG